MEVKSHHKVPSHSVYRKDSFWFRVGMYSRKINASASCAATSSNEPIRVDTFLATMRLNDFVDVVAYKSKKILNVVDYVMSSAWEK